MLHHDGGDADQAVGPFGRKFPGATQLAPVRGELLDVRDLVGNEECCSATRLRLRAGSAPASTRSLRNGQPGLSQTVEHVRDEFARPEPLFVLLPRLRVEVRL
jgi:hypothetical protein